MHMLHHCEMQMAQQGGEDTTLYGRECEEGGASQGHVTLGNLRR